MCVQTITNFEKISYDFIQIISKWPLFTSDKHTYIARYTCITYKNCKSSTTKWN